MGLVTSDSRSVSEGSNPYPAATEKPPFAGLSLLDALPGPPWTRPDPHGVMVKVMVGFWVGFDTLPAVLPVWERRLVLGIGDGLAECQAGASWPFPASGGIGGLKS